MQVLDLFQEFAGAALIIRERPSLSLVSLGSRASPATMKAGLFGYRARNLCLIAFKLSTSLITCEVFKSSC